MPELPEVETIRRSLEPLIVGRRIETVDVRCAALRVPVPDSLSGALVGRSIEAAERRGKFLLFHLSDEPRRWIVHLGMSGRLLHAAMGVGDTDARHDHVVVSLGDGCRLVYNDPRRFGLMLLERTEDCRWLAGLGPEPLDRERFDGRYLAAVRRGTRRTVKDVLMDQRIVAGLGNIYVNEILFVAGVRPRRRMDRVTAVELDRIVEAVRLVIAEAIEHRGSTVSDFLDGIGRRGGYQWRHRVYDREGAPCPRCEQPIKSVTVAQRSSFYCPRCQK